MIDQNGLDYRLPELMNTIIDADSKMSFRVSISESELLLAHSCFESQTSLHIHIKTSQMYNINIL